MFNACSFSTNLSNVLDTLSRIGQMTGFEITFYFVAHKNTKTSQKFTDLSTINQNWIYSDTRRTTGNTIHEAPKCFCTSSMNFKEFHLFAEIKSPRNTKCRTTILNRRIYEEAKRKKCGISESKYGN